jgi:hypothetical protein
LGESLRLFATRQRRQFCTTIAIARKRAGIFLAKGDPHFDIPTAHRAANEHPSPGDSMCASKHGTRQKERGASAATADVGVDGRGKDPAPNMVACAARPASRALRAKFIHGIRKKR